ncbi:MAG: DUF1858 domain-containing protein [Candidatus Latescibacteria bacterium]|nr:DUF1858 domain-containing protein [Candidatus Latescibacterota bacterium]NIM21992.1 DUF1858 domain-containing protein [Candidatus Latescibacterota bacterium]NIM66010.1 DUF1858 domain-containing protein [Candidatus Latescibacterota bacterium]NIO02418.1 DUF1858 domain-containing protein [Candidatus Latescibacterota bacterium]NIO29329.1 DUF1858 domain-containing protein [Candidatus Latescibacterota bacterium]
MIERNTLIEDLVRELPKAVGYLRKRGIKCLACGEPIWGTIESSGKQKGFTDEEVDRIVEDLRALQKGGNDP